MPVTVKSRVKMGRRPHGRPLHKRPEKPTSTNETHGYLSGMFAGLTAQVSDYIDQVHQLLFAQARVELAEKNLRNTREHFADQIAKCKNAVPGDWDLTLSQARFVGARLSEACMVLLKEHRRLSPKQMVDFLNSGNYRFRTPTPFREIHGALLKQNWVGRVGEDYVWSGPDPQIQLIGSITPVDDSEEVAS